MGAGSGYDQYTLCVYVYVYIYLQISKNKKKYLLNKKKKYNLKHISFT